jgi:hypothetical protein
MSLIGTHAVERALHASNTNAEIVGFVPSDSGTLEVVFRKDSASVTLQVVAGSYYPFDVEKFLVAGSTAQSNLVIIFGSYRAG